MFRSLVFLALGAGVAFGAWSSLPQTQAIPWHGDESVTGFVEPGASDLVHQAKFAADASADAGYTISRETIEAIRCGPWDVSDAGMEAILEEMIRRGWTPPSRAAAIANTQSRFGVQVTALDPQAPAAAVQPPEAPVGSTLPAPNEPTPALPVQALEPTQPALPFGPSQVPGASEQQPRFTN